MTADYFTGGSKEYFKPKIMQEKKEEKENIKNFNIPTDKYTKTAVRVVIKEYEIKD